MGNVMHGFLSDLLISGTRYSFANVNVRSALALIVADMENRSYIFLAKSVRFICLRDGMWVCKHTQGLQLSCGPFQIEAQQLFEHRRV